MLLGALPADAALLRPRPSQAGAATPGSTLLTRGTYLPSAVWSASSYALLTGVRADTVSAGGFPGGLSGSAASPSTPGASGGGSGSGASGGLSPGGWGGIIVATFIAGALTVCAAVVVAARCNRAAALSKLTASSMLTNPMVVVAAAAAATSCAGGGQRQSPDWSAGAFPGQPRSVLAAAVPRVLPAALAPAGHVGGDAESAGGGSAPVAAAAAAMAAEDASVSVVVGHPPMPPRRKVSLAPAALRQHGATFCSSFPRPRPPVP